MVHRVCMALTINVLALRQRCCDSTQADGQLEACLEMVLKGLQARNIITTT